MNVIVRRTSSKARSESPRKRSDNEFLPAALEILEMPASPIRIAFMWFAASVVAAALVWSYFGTFDIVATGQGKIQPSGRVKVIQSTETGRAAFVAVADGSEVRAGDLLIKLDDTELKSDVDGIAAELDGLTAEAARRDSAVAVARIWQVQNLPSGAREYEYALEAVPSQYRERETAVYQGDLSQLDSTLANIAAQGAQQQAAVDRLKDTIEAQTQLVNTLGERVKIHSALIDQSAGTRASLIDAIETQQKEVAVLVEQKGQMTEAKAALVVAASEIRKAFAGFIAENVNRLGDVGKKIDTLQQQLIKARKRRDSMTIVSPINGIVQASSITTAGQMIASGVELMRIVPSQGDLEVEAYLPNRDIGFVYVGQSAVVKIEAFPFTRYGTISGVVTAVARDAIPEPDASQLEGNPIRSMQSAMPIANAQRVQNLVFPVKIKLVERAIFVDGQVQPLSPGMSASVEIKTGKRRILEYLFSPLAEVGASAMRER